MQVLSSSQCLQLHDFPLLNIVSKYGEGNATGSVDFQFLLQSSMFVASNPGLPFEFLTKRSKNDHEEIAFVRRVRTETANTVACPNSEGSDIAVGNSTGTVQLLHYRSMTESNKFTPPAMKDAVVSLSYNCKDDLLASLHESGVVQVFGLNTSVRTDLIAFDKEVSHIRFHPKRKLHLGMVSYDGSVHLYDTQTKRRIFTHMAHQSPCRDLAMSPVNDNCLVSVGYDHLINLFDTRTKIASIQLATAHPLSACAISPCGSFCCVGNLRGQLLAYDFRQLKEPLIQTKSSHSTSIKRIEFLPSTEDSLNLTEGNEMETRGMQPGRRDSMQNFFEHHYKRLPEQRKLSNLFSAENTSGTRISLGHDLKRLLREEEAVRSRNDSTDSSDVEFVSFAPGVPSVPAGIKAEAFKLLNDPQPQPVSLMSIHSSSTTEECAPRTPVENTQLRRLTKGRVSGLVLSRGNRTEDQIIPEDEEFPQVLRPTRKSVQTSTPLNSAPAVSSPLVVPVAVGKKLLINEKDLGDGDGDTNGVKKNNGGELGERPRIQLERNVSVEMSAELEARMNEKIEHLEKQLQFQLEGNTWELKNYNMIMYLKQMEAMEGLQKTVDDLTAGMNCLIQSDDFMAEFFRLRLENEELKARLMGNGH